jgi:hypothetical protein
MAKRPCLEPGCPVLTTRTRCPDHTRSRDRARGTRQQRGYDAAYDAERRRIQAEMDAGQQYLCWRCPELGLPEHTVDPTDWHLGHDTRDRSIIRGPQCPATNLDTSPDQAAPGPARGPDRGGTQGWG